MKIFDKLLRSKKIFIEDKLYKKIQKREKERSIIMQKLENEKIERGIKNEAQRWVNEYNNALTIKIGETEFKNCIHIMRPFIYAIMIYDEETAKYNGCNIRQLVNEEYQKLISLNFVK